MSFFQNPFPEDFRGNWVLGDRAQSLVFFCPQNTGRDGNTVVSWKDGPFDLSGNDADGNSRDTLQIRLAIYPNFDRWALMSFDITTTASSTSAVTPTEIVGALNGNTEFASWFSATLNPQNERVTIRSAKPSNEIKFYVVNGRAEEALRFNERAGVNELPTYFDRHKVKHLFTAAEFLRFPEGDNILIPLDPVANTVDANIIDNAVDRKGKSLNFNSNSVKADWELLEGRSGLFVFQKICLDENGDIAQIIEYHAGAKIGDMARRICYTRSGGGANSNPVQITEEPYTLQAADLIEPDCSECEAESV